MGPGTTIYDPAWIVAALAAAYAIYRTLWTTPASGSQPKPAEPSPPPPPPPVIQAMPQAALMEQASRAADLKVADLLQERLTDLKARRMIGELYQSIRPEDYKL